MTTTSTRLHCTNCGIDFDKPKGRPRCPQCLRTHGLETVAARPTSSRAKSRLPVFIGAIAAVAVVVGGAAYLMSSGGTPGSGMSDEDILDAMRTNAVPADLLHVPFGAAASVRSFAGNSLSSGDDLARANALLGVFNTLRTGGKLSLASSYRPALRAPERADALATGLPAGTTGPLYSYEVASLFLAAARDAGMDVQLAEAFALPTSVSPDPTAIRGHYVVVVGGAAGTFFDPATGATGPVNTANLRLLDDVQAVAPFLVLKAVNLLEGHFDSAGAHRMLQSAARLDPPARGGPSPTLLGARARTFLEGGGALEAVAEMEKALAIAADAARHVALAEALLAMAEMQPDYLNRARTLAKTALEKDPTLARAHRLEAMIALLDDDTDRAKAAVAAARTAGLTGATLAMLEARLAIAEGDTDKAIATLEAEIAKGEATDDLSFALIQTLIDAGRPADAQAVAAKLVETSPRGDILRPMLAELLDAPIPTGPGFAPDAMGLGGGLMGSDDTGPSLLDDGDTGPGIRSGGGLLGGPGGLGGGRPSLLGGERLKLGFPGMGSSDDSAPAPE